MNEPNRHERVSRIMRACLDAAPEERDALLQREAAGDTSIIREVESLLGYDALSDDDVFSDNAIQEGRHALHQLIDEAPQSSHGVVETPVTIANYRVIRKIGEGGMGVVYEAEQENPRRRVALKVIRTHMASSQLIKRFQREAHLLGRLQHPGIAHVYESGFASVGTDWLPFFAMELIEGLPLDEYARRRNLDVRRRLRLLALTADAVHHAHQKGVIHRDLKPANILVVAGSDDEAPGTSEDSSADSASVGGGRPKVLDFGIARCVDPEATANTIFTRAGQVVGTLSYMSPEQLSGAGGDLDTRCDVYSLGVIAYELMSGRRPHDLTDVSIFEAAQVIRDNEPARLTLHDERLRGDIETIIAKAMDKAPDRRYASAAEFAADIRRYLNDEPIDARPASALYQARKFARRHRAVVAGAFATLVSLVLGLAGVTWLAVREGAARREAQAYAKESAVSAYLGGLAAASGAIRDQDIPGAEQHLLRAPESLRGWEWRYLFGQLDQSVAVVEAPGHGLNSQIAFSRDGGEVLLVRQAHSAEKTGRLVRLRSPDLAIIADEGFDTVRNVAMTRWGDALILIEPQGRAELMSPIRIAAERLSIPLSLQLSVELSSGRCALKNWPDAGAATAQLLCAHRAIEATNVRRGNIRFSDDGRLMAIMNLREPFDASLWDVEGGRRIADLPPHPEGVGDAAFSPDDARFVTAGRNREIRMWRLSPGIELEWAIDEAHTDAALAIAFNRDGTKLVSGGEDRIVRLWDAATGASAGVLVGHREPVNDVAFSPDGRRVASCDRSALRMWNVDTASDHGVLRGHTYQVRDMDVSPDGAMLASIASELILWDLSRRSPVTTISRENIDGATPIAVRFADQGAILIVAWKSADSSKLMLEVHDADAGVTRGCVIDEWIGENVGGISVDSRSRRFAVAVNSETHIFRMDDLREVARLRGMYAEFSPDGRFIATGESMDGGVCLFDAESFDMIRSWPKASGQIAFSADSRRICAALAQVNIIDDIGSDDVRSFGESEGVFRSVIVSPDGSRIITGGRDRMIRVWDAGSGAELVQLRGHLDSVDGLRFCAGGECLFSCSGDYTIRIWDARGEGTRCRELKMTPSTSEEIRRFVDLLSPSD
ncbi:MAG TPA: serine/threonine-protein kinase [Phycisphaerae bacterium]|nr:serine/threonine-protein kinase [Phycisphaerae bacterium]HRW51779.1 serine/threonine-protein kinase [Phycisphaerae bacterium]